jgi:hypothetical protein
MDRSSQEQFVQSFYFKDSRKSDAQEQSHESMAIFYRQPISKPLIENRMATADYQSTYSETVLEVFKPL